MYRVIEKSSGKNLEDFSSPYLTLADEATAFTDPENEDKIQQSIARLTKGKTLLVIAHRLSTIQRADNIIVLENGSILAQGRHKELLESCPLYRKMWKAHIGAKEWAVSASGSALPVKHEALRNGQKQGKEV